MLNIPQSGTLQQKNLAILYHNQFKQSLAYPALDLEYLLDKIQTKGKGEIYKEYIKNFKLLINARKDVAIKFFLFKPKQFKNAKQQYDFYYDSVLQAVEAMKPLEEKIAPLKLICECIWLDDFDEVDFKQKLRGKKEGKPKCTRR